MVESQSGSVESQLSVVMVLDRSSGSGGVPCQRFGSTLLVLRIRSVTSIKYVWGSLSALVQELGTNTGAHLGLTIPTRRVALAPP